MLPEIKSIFTTAKATLDLTKAVKSVKEKADIDAYLSDIRDHIGDLQEKLLEAQQATDTILEERRQAITDLEEERTKNSTLEKYRLVEPRASIFLYSYRSSEDDETPDHFACPNCYINKVVSILQQPDSNIDRINCSACAFSYSSRTKEEWDIIEQEHDAIQRAHDSAQIIF